MYNHMGKTFLSSGEVQSNLKAFKYCVASPCPLTGPEEVCLSPSHFWSDWP